MTASLLQFEKSENQLGRLRKPVKFSGEVLILRGELQISENMIQEECCAGRYNVTFSHLPANIVICSEFEYTVYPRLSELPSESVIINKPFGQLSHPVIFFDSTWLHLQVHLLKSIFDF